MRVNQKGQVTIPAAIRRNTGLSPGIEVEFEVVDGGVLIRPVPGSSAERARRIVDRLHNARFDKDLTTAELMRLTRGDDWQSASPS